MLVVSDSSLASTIQSKLLQCTEHGFTMSELLSLMLPQLDQQMVLGGSQCNLSTLSVPCCILGSDHNVDVQVLAVQTHATLLNTTFICLGYVNAGKSVWQDIRQMWKVWLICSFVCIHRQSFSLMTACLANALLGVSICICKSCGCIT